MSGTVTITPGYEFPADSTAITKARLNLLANPTAQVAAGAITSRELSSSVLPVDPTTKTVLFEDFMVDNALSNVIGACNLRTLNNGVSSSVAIGTSTAGHPGVVTFTEGTSATSYAFIRGANATANSVVLGGGATEITWQIGAISTLSDGVNDAYSLYIGLANGAANGNEPTDGIYFHYTHSVNSGQWVGKTARGSSRTSVNSSVTVAINTWYTLKAVANAAGTSVEFFVNGVSIGTASTAANIPNTAITPICGINVTTGTALNISFQADYMKLALDFTNTR